MPKTITIICIVLISIFILIGLIRQTLTAIDVSDRLNAQADELNKLQERNRELKDRLAQTQTYEFYEEIARDKLNMSKPGETVVVIPDEVIEGVLGAKKAIPEPELPNWQGWLKLILR